MAIAFRAAGAIATADGVAAITLAAPAGTVSTDVVLAVLICSQGTNRSYTPPAGWTLAASRDDGTNFGVKVYWGLGSSTFGDWQPVVTGGQTAGFTVGYTGVDNTTPMDATAVSQLNASSATSTAPTITTVTANALLVGFFGQWDSLGNAIPTWSSEFGTHRQSGGLRNVIASTVSADCCALVQASAGASGSKTALASATHPSMGFLVALRPAVAAAGPVAFVQSKQFNGASTPTSLTYSVTLTSAVKAGNLLAVHAFWGQGVAGDFTSCTDDIGNTYTAVDSVATNSDVVRTFYAKNIKGGTPTILMTLSVARAFESLEVIEVAGCDVNAPLDQHVTNTQAAPGTGTDAVTSGAVTTTKNGEYIFGGVAVHNTVVMTQTAGTGYTVRDNAPGDATHGGFTSEDKIQAAAGSVSATFTISNSQAVTTVIMTFIPAADESITQYFENDVEYFETPESNGDAAPYDFYQSAPVIADVAAAVDQIVPECSDNQLEDEDESLYPDYWSQGPPPDDVTNQLFFVPLGYDYDDPDGPPDSIDQPLSADAAAVATDQIAGEDASAQLEDQDEAFEFVDVPLPADLVAQVDQIVPECADAQPEDEEQAQDVNDQPLPDDNDVGLRFDFLPAEEPDAEAFDFASDPLAADLVAISDQIVAEDGSGQPEEAEELDGFSDGPVIADVIAAPDQIVVEDASTQLEDVVEPFDWQDAPLSADALVQSNQVFVESADNQLEDFDDPLDWADQPLANDVAQAPDQIVVEDASGQQEDEPEPLDWLDQPLAADNEVVVPREISQPIEEDEEAQDFAFAPLPDDIQSDQVFSEDAANQFEDEEPTDGFIDQPFDVVVLPDQISVEDGSNQLDEFDEPYDFVDTPLSADKIVQSDQVFIEDAANQPDEIDPPLDWADQPLESYPLVLDPGRTYAVVGEDRRLAIIAQDRRFAVPAEDRRLIVPANSRALIV